MYGALLSMSHSKFCGIQMDTKKREKSSVEGTNKSFQNKQILFLGDSYAQLLHW